MDEDIALGQRIARNCKKMSVQAFVGTIEQEMDFNRFDYEGGETEWMIAVLTAYRGYTLAGGVLDFGDIAQMQ